MLANLLICTFVGPAMLDNRASDIIHAMSKVLEKAQTAELTITGETGPLAKRIPYVANVKICRDPLRYLSLIQGSEDINPQIAAFSDGSLRYTDENGKTVSKATIHNEIVNDASGPGISGWNLIFAKGLYEKCSDSNAVYVHAEEVGGKSCDLVGVVNSKQEESEQITTINYIWIERQTHLPLAYQRHLLLRGKSGLGAKFFVSNLVLNLVWQMDPWINLPEQLPVQVKGPDYSVDAPKSTLSAGDVCPNLAVRLLDVKSGKFTDARLATQLHGKTLLTFWAPWCGPCIQELNVLREVPEFTSGKLRVVAVCVFDLAQNCRNYATTEKLPFDIALDPDSEKSFSSLAKAFGISGIPHAFLFDSKGKLIRHWVGFESKEALLKKLSD